LGSVSLAGFFTFYQRERSDTEQGAHKKGEMKYLNLMIGCKEERFTSAKDQGHDNIKVTAITTILN